MVAEMWLESGRANANVALASWIPLAPDEYCVVPSSAATLVGPAVQGRGARASKTIRSTVAPPASTPSTRALAAMDFDQATRADALAIWTDAPGVVWMSSTCAPCRLAEPAT